ncbi:hypothetical protein AMTRI_Chr05g64370 [Amborella trichopoda]
MYGIYSLFLCEKRGTMVFSRGGYILCMRKLPSPTDNFLQNVFEKSVVWPPAWAAQAAGRPHCIGLSQCSPLWDGNPGQPTSFLGNRLGSNACAAQGPFGECQNCPC